MNNWRIIIGTKMNNLTLSVHKLLHSTLHAHVLTLQKAIVLGLIVCSQPFNTSIGTASNTALLLHNVINT